MGNIFLKASTDFFDITPLARTRRLAKLTREFGGKGGATVADCSFNPTQPRSTANIRLSLEGEMSDAQREYVETVNTGPGFIKA